MDINHLLKKDLSKLCQPQSPEQSRSHQSKWYLATIFLPIELRNPWTRKESILKSWFKYLWKPVKYVLLGGEAMMYKFRFGWRGIFVNVEINISCSTLQECLVFFSLCKFTSVVSLEQIDFKHLNCLKDAYPWWILCVRPLSDTTTPMVFDDGYELSRIVGDKFREVGGGVALHIILLRHCDVTIMNYIFWCIPCNFVEYIMYVSFNLYYQPIIVDID